VTRRDPDLELDPGWLAQRELERQMAMRPPEPPKRPKRTGVLVVALLLVGLVGAGVVAIVMHEREPAPPPVSTKGASISIRAVGAVEVHIDGAFVGRTPLLYSARKSKKPILIEARQIGAVQQIVPDHDQEVFLPASR
jgi:hypothetical protein